MADIDISKMTDLSGRNPGPMLPPKVAAGKYRQAGETAGKKVKKAKKKRGPFFGFVFGLAVSLLIFAAVISLLYFNVADLREVFIQRFKLDETSFQMLESQKQDLELKTAELNDQKTVLEKEQNEAQTQAADIARQSEALSARQTEIDQLQASLTAQAADLKSIAAWYESMEPAAAADIFTAFTDQSKLILIIKNMNQTRIALILAEMDPAQVSQLMTAMMEPSSGS
ncbi:MAG: hypothetical protein VB070_06435 [Clostridiaceae bacterium]|nr:hypothetical protein [Clostridiaceae bacterium]